MDGPSAVTPKSTLGARAAHWALRTYSFFRWNAVIRPRLRRMGRGGVFAEIYKLNVWGNFESRSGVGSTMQATAAIRSALPRLFADFAIASMLDIPCGDFNWMRLVDLPARYIGADIVPDLVENNRRTYGDGKIAFEVIDLVHDALPKVDLIFCRDCLIHLSFADIRSALDNIKKSGSQYVLTSLYTSLERNTDITTGEFRTVNPCLPPISLPEPVMILTETNSDPMRPDKSLGLWRIDDIP